MKTDYTIEIKKLISDNYQPVESRFAADEYTEKKTLKEIHRMVTNILPKDWVYESDVYGILEELGFNYFIHTFPEVRNDEDEVISSERTDLFYFMDRKTAAI